MPTAKPYLKKKQQLADLAKPKTRGVRLRKAKVKKPRDPVYWNGVEEFRDPGPVIAEGDYPYFIEPIPEPAIPEPPPAVIPPEPTPPKEETRFDFSKLPTLKVYKGEHIGTYTLSSYGGSMGCGVTTLSSVSLNGYFADKRGHSAIQQEWEPTEELMAACSKYLADKFNGYGLVVLSDAVNYETTGKKSQLVANRAWNTGKFIEYLVKFKIGTIYLSPIVRNVTHRKMSDFSLCQVAVWIPPVNKSMVVPGTGGVIGDTEFSKEEWVKGLGEDWPNYKALTWDKWKEKIFPTNSVLFEKAT